MNKKIKIIIDVERMKNPFTGLYYYCKDLATNMEKYHADEFDFYFFSHPKVEFPKNLKTIILNFFDRYYLIKPKKYRLWHTTWQNTKYIPKNNIKLILTIHDLNFLYTDKSQLKKNRILQTLQKKIDRANAVTTISNYVKKDIQKYLKLNGKEVNVVHNGVDFLKFPQFDSPKYKPKHKFLFGVGTVVRKKNFHVLLPLLRGNDYELIIAGIHSSLNYLKFFKDEIKKTNLSNRVHLLGSITDKEKYWYMNNCEAFLFPSISEGFGLPPIEAMLFGKPVFLSTYTSLPEIGGKYAYYFTSFEPKAMRKALELGLLDYIDNNKKEEIIEWAKQYTWRKATTKYIDIYKKVLRIDKKETSKLHANK